jgi:prolyl-tRNA editing enzyme YbaK/EbsC (Cys-tRNA(Pro) deacylase)
VTGFAIGGVAPVGHTSPPRIFIDRDLMRLDPVFAAAGTPRHVFKTSGANLARITGGTVTDVKED